MNNTKGFTLVEVIIAIGILMLASGFILQIFMTAKNMNERAHAIDQSVSITTNFVETIKTMKTPMNEPYEDIFPQSEVTQNGENILITYYYKQDWTLANLSEKKGAPYTFTGSLKHNKNGMIAIDARMVENKKDNTQRELFKLNAGQWEGSLHE